VGATKGGRQNLHFIQLSFRKKESCEFKNALPFNFFEFRKSKMAGLQTFEVEASTGPSAVKL